ncbi:VOC family protein [Actinoplanes sp. NPDC048796]|uniref:VOC family protein n=1 Tax=Actinoplanes sp. NPDC048796 TaxID=3155640 RepID=UPI0033CED598
MDQKLEVIVIPVSDVDRAKDFYKRLGWREDADFVTGPDFRVIQVTPPGSPCSVIFGTGVTSARPGSAQDLVLAVDDIEAAQSGLLGLGVDISDVYHDAGGIFYHAGTAARVPGPDPERRTYASYAAFADPDGNGWVLQEVTTRLPGRLWSDFGTDVAVLADLLGEAEQRHGRPDEAGKWNWYAPYIAARRLGRSPEEAAREASAATPA